MSLWFSRVPLHFLLLQQKVLVWTLTSISPAVLMYDFTFSARVQRECCWQPWAHWFMKKKADLVCLPVGTGGGKKIHLGHASCYMSVCVGSLFYPFSELSHCSQLWGWCEVTSAWQRGPWDLVGIPHFPLAPPTSGKTWSAVKTRIKMLLHIEQWW